MRKTSKNPQNQPFSKPKTPKTQKLTHSLTSNPSLQSAPDTKNHRSLMVICPNCEYHFKVQLKLLEAEDSKSGHIYHPSESLQKLIQKEYSLISSFSRSGQQIQNSPIVKVKNKPEIEDLILSDINGLERLQLLNQLKQLQKSRMQDSKVTVRFNPSPNDSPIQEFVESSPEVSPSPVQPFFSPDSQANLQLNPQNMSKGKTIHEGKLRETILDYYQCLQMLNALINWVISNQHYRTLPSYLKLLIDESQVRLGAFSYF